MKKLLPSLLIFFLPTIILASDTLILRPGSNGKDALVFSNNATRNYGNANAITIYTWTNNGNLGNKRGFLEFDLSQIPSSATIDSAKLSLYYITSVNTESFFVHTGGNDMWLERISSPWKEDSITWNNQPSTTTVNRVHIDSSTSGTQDYTNIDVTALVRDMLDTTNGNYGFALKMQDEVNYYKGVLLASSDHTDSTIRPKLEIYYSRENSCKAMFTIEKDTSAVNNIILYNESSNFIGHKYHWDFGEGTTASGRTPIHTYQNFGSYEVCLTITDSILGCDTTTFCDTVGMDSLGNLKAGFGVEVRDRLLVGIENEKVVSNEIVIYPNPTNGLLKIKLTNRLESNQIRNIEVFSLNRQAVSHSYNSTNSILDLSNNSPGLYFVRIRDDKEIHTKKVILR